MAVDAFLKIDGIPGESRDKAHPGEIEVLSYSWGVTNTGSSSVGGGGGEGKASFHEFTFSSHVTKASPLLAEACATGQHIKIAWLSVRKAGGSIDFYKPQFSDIIVTSYGEGGSEGAQDDAPINQVSLNFDKCDIDYRVVNPNGSIADEVRVQIDLSEVGGAGG